MWKLEPNDEYEKRVRQWPKKYRRELKAMLSHLDTVFRALQQGAQLNDICFGFVHPEPKGIKALDQKGAGSGVTQTRLYIFPDVKNKIVHLITIGDKHTQKADVQFAISFVDSLNASEEESNG